MTLGQCKNDGKVKIKTFTNEKTFKISWHWIFKENLSKKFRDKYERLLCFHTWESFQQQNKFKTQVTLKAVKKLHKSTIHIYTILKCLNFDLNS